jgi:hypothetical protein
VSAFRGARALRSHSFDLPMPLPEAFPLFEPEGERAWAPGWDPRYIHPADGRPQKGMVFVTGADDEETLWLVLRHEPRAGAVEYARITPGNRAAIVRVQCDAIDAGSTRVTVSYEYTGLSEAGNAYVRSMDEGHFRDFIASWKEMIAAARR